MASPPSSLPSDCLLHVFLRLDPVSIIRCAAVSIIPSDCLLHVIDNASEIRCHPCYQAERRRLLGFHYRERYPGELSFSHRTSWSPSARRHWSDGLPAPSHVPVAKGTKTKDYVPLACSDGLLLLCRGLPSRICVCNPLTGFHASMPHPDDQLVTCRYFLHSCHGVEPNPSPESFQVLVVGIDNDDSIPALQNYCSRSGVWGPAFRPTAGELRMPCDGDYDVAPVVCRGAICWLCNSESGYQSGQQYFFQQDKITYTVAVDISTERARMTRLPKRCSMSKCSVSIRKMLMLATSEGDRLSLLRREDQASLDVSIWLYAGEDHGGSDDNGEKSWVFWRSFNIRKLIEDAGLAHYRPTCKDWSVLEARLEWFCPRSHRVIIWIPYFASFVLDPESMQIQRAAGIILWTYGLMR